MVGSGKQCYDRVYPRFASITRLPFLFLSGVKVESIKIFSLCCVKDISFLDFSCSLKCTTLNYIQAYRSIQRLIANLTEVPFASFNSSHPILTIPPLYCDPFSEKSMILNSILLFFSLISISSSN